MIASGHRHSNEAPKACANADHGKGKASMASDASLGESCQIGSEGSPPGWVRLGRLRQG